ncbi:MAG: response regulator transcription factor [Chitinophagales bacterium]|nr:response regulator transcription factor [Chitinophagales bacterium]
MINKRLILFGVMLAVLMLVLQVAQYRFIILEHSAELYAGIVAVVFVVLGIVMGRKLTTPKEVVIEKLVPVAVNQSAPFAVNEQVLEKLNISKREHEILLLIAQGLSNQEIADKTFVSINTVKTHVSNLLLKLDAKRRAQAIQKARELSLLP